MAMRCPAGTGRAAWTPVHPAAAAAAYRIRRRSRKRPRQSGTPAAATAATAARRQWARLAPHLPRHPAAATAAVAAAATAPSASALEVDVCVLGAGIIGLCTALTLLRSDPQLRVAVVDRDVPCSGATGAGQGYLWLTHRDPSSPAWRLAVRSKQMWQELLAPTVPELTPAAVEWQAVGSMLLASTQAESEALRQRQQLLAGLGLEASLLPAPAAQQLEPALQLSEQGSALLVPTDAQVNGKASAAALQRACEAHDSRFTPLFHEGAVELVAGPSGRVEGVQTEARRVHATLGVVASMGAWTGTFLAAQLSDVRWADAFKPRRGLLLEMPRPEKMPAVAHGMMEVGYTQHYSKGGTDSTQQAHGGTDITFTATTSASGTLLVGSSREFAWEGDHDAANLDAIMRRAQQFLPGLAAVRREDIHVRAGPRPYATAGSPIVAPVPGAEGLLVAAGHEGSGLTLAPATAELISAYLQGQPPQLEAAVVDSLRVPF